LSYPNRSPDLVYDLASSQLSTQVEAIDALDGKIAVLLSLASALLGIAAATFALHVSVASGRSVNTLTHRDLVVLAVGIAVYIVISYKGIRAYFCKDWDIGPKALTIWDQFETDKSDDRIKWGAANDLIYAYEDNDAAYRGKLAAVKWIFPGVAVETLALVVAIALVAWGA
jgi:hypothetical protein